MKNNNIILRKLGFSSIGIGRSNKQFIKGQLDNIITELVKKHGYVRIYPDRKEVHVRIGDYRNLTLQELKDEFENKYQVKSLMGNGTNLWVLIKHEVVFE